MIVFLLVIVVLLIGLTTAAFLGRINGFMAEPTSSHAFAGLPAESLTADDIGTLRFDRALRGYRMDQVDEVIVALSTRVRELEKGGAAPAEGGAFPAGSAETPADGVPWLPLDDSRGGSSATQEQ
ncbi:MAG: DivIVA domain-containing protein [Dermatophilaceae bacterium]